MTNGERVEFARDLASAEVGIFHRPSQAFDQINWGIFSFRETNASDVKKSAILDRVGVVGLY